MTNSEMIRIRRQMHRRIRDVVAERRLARLAVRADDDPDAAVGSTDQPCADRSLIAG